MTKSCAVVLSLLLFATPKLVFASSLTDFVLNVYKQYSWVSVMAPSASSKFVALQDEKLVTLEKYFSKTLSSAIYADGICKRTTKEICKIDFDILFASQDVFASDLVVTNELAGSVSVCFKIINGAKCLRIEAHAKASDWRISNIVYSPEEYSLASILGIKQTSLPSALKKPD
jgi:hypothetical protein